MKDGFRYIRQIIDAGFELVSNYETMITFEHKAQNIRVRLGSVGTENGRRWDVHLSDKNGIEISWISPDNYDMLKMFVDYARHLMSLEEDEEDE